MNQVPSSTSTTSPGTAAEKSERAFRMALDLYRQRPSWITFFREILGVDGAINRMFASRDELREFEATEEYGRIQQMLTQLRDSDNAPEENREATKVITVRLPSSLHESLRAEARTRNTSMNKLCIAKLLGALEEEENVETPVG